ncbi:hypothetical protein ADK67_07720 [Saccharothrix sp. NRRL B-16348]|uniref:hypothetical protein n=1 Tax=Saccharothrix sp. NRRL B-16348 TaxID=1415542 RepID=UPI0006AFE6E4|nr:hypothetical protein [Saccharothrix sp. NRRL B-16348]KOX32545.1 hypothetical protein ADK67_07720 [Saccharothrix sp. NRRL B-16348]
MTVQQAQEAASTPTDEPAEGPEPRYDRRTLNEVQVNLYSPRFERAVLGAQTVGGWSSRPLTRATGRVDDGDIAALSRFVSPEGFGPAVEQLAADRLLVLCGAPGTGKRSSALALLRQVTDQSLYLMSPHVSPAELAEYEYESGCGYLVIDRVTEYGGEPDFEWRVVRDRARDRDCYLVITEPPAIVVDRTCHVAWHAPASERVLRAYWDGTLPADEEPVLHEALASIDSVRDVVGLAEWLARGLPLDQALEHLDARIRVEVEEWFEEADRRQVLEVTALAFATGVDERTFESAMRLLQQVLDRDVPTASDEAVEPDRLPQLRRDLLTNELVATSTLHTDLGTRGALRFARAGHHRPVLAQLWQRMDVVFWDAVVEWLDEIVTDSRYEVPVAVGLAELATIALDEVVRVLDRWARGTRRAAGRRVAVYVLHLMAYDEVLAPAALKIAAGWVERGTPQQRWVAAMAFIGGLGARYPHDARRRLWTVCTQSHTVHGDVEHVFGELFATLVRDTDNAHLVLHYLRDKVTRFNAPGARPASRAVAMRTALAVLESRKSDAKRSAVLLHLEEHPEGGDVVVRLLASVLVFRPLRLRAIKALHALLEDMAENDPRARANAHRLGVLLHSTLPVWEHEALDADFRVVAARRQDTDIRSLVDAVLDALKGRVS